MSRPRTLPEKDSELIALIRKHGRTGVAKMFGVTPEAVSKAIKDRKLPIEPARASYRDLIPWTVATEHVEIYERRMLRYWAMREKGMPLDHIQEGQLKLFLERLDENDAVIEYDREADPPFAMVLRREGETGYVRWPDPEPSDS